MIKVNSAKVRKMLKNELKSSIEKQFKQIRFKEFFKKFFEESNSF